MQVIWNVHIFSYSPFLLFKKTTVRGYALSTESGINWLMIVLFGGSVAARRAVYVRPGGKSPIEVIVLHACIELSYDTP